MNDLTVVIDRAQATLAELEQIQLRTARTALAEALTIAGSAR